MVIGGIQPCSFSDYPGKVAAVLFTQGCNFRCPFCHNGSLLARKDAGVLKEKDAFDFLKRRIGQLGGVVISGGEPTEQPDLPDFVGRIKELGFPVKLDTNGSNPLMVEKLLSRELVDYIAMDIKAPLSKYDVLCGVKVDPGAICQTISLISASSVTHHFRTTLVEPLITEQDLEEIQSLVPAGARHVVQPFIAETAWQFTGLVQ